MRIEKGQGPLPNLRRLRDDPGGAEEVDYQKPEAACSHTKRMLTESSEPPFAILCERSDAHWACGAILLASRMSKWSDPERRR